MSKYFIILLIIFAVVGVGYRLSVDLKNPASTTQKTYLNEELGITFSYPDTAQIKILEPILIPRDGNAQDVMIEATVMDPKGDSPKVSDFFREMTKVSNFYLIQTSRFEGVIAYRAYLEKDNFLLPITYQWSTDKWSDPTYDPKKDEQYTEFINILHSVSFIHTSKGEYEGLH